MFFKEMFSQNRGITENTFIDILGLPEWDDKVIEVLETLELPRPILKEGDVDKFLHSKKYGIELFIENLHPRG